jgi:4-diphosphocytidyl-2-C-methyl-D-erythritol kinase
MLEIIPADTFSFDTTGDAIPGDIDQNLCVKAYRLLQQDFNLPPVKIHLHKIIPSGAGLGGGSSDATHTLRLINEVFALKISHEVLVQYASRLGSDCAFFVYDKPMLGKGRGELLTEATLSLKGKFVVLVQPDIHVSTADAFAGIVPRVPSQSIDEIVSIYPVERWRGILKNDFEDSVFKKHQVLHAIKEKLYARDAQYASMSGTGSSLFGIFDKPVDLQQEFPGMRYWSGTIG